MPHDAPEFRPGDVLATRFTGTLSERHGVPVERLPTPERLVDWFAWSGLAVDDCTAGDLEQARLLRESIHAAATAAATGDALPGAAIEVLNACSARGSAFAVLTPDRCRRWSLGPESAIDDALGVIATDAISLLTGGRAGRLALCASPTCRAAFLDTSRGRTRRWCDMNTCGNKEKKARFVATRRAGEKGSGQ